MSRNGTGPAGVGDGAEKQTTGQGAHAVSTIDQATVTTPEPRWCTFTRAYCRCNLVDLERVTMAVCGRHFMDEVAGE